MPARVDFLQARATTVDKPIVTVTPSRQPLRGAVHAGMLALLRSEPDWLIEVLVALGRLPAPLPVELFPSEAWPRGEEGRRREVRADLWPIEVPPSPSLRRVRRQIRGAVVLELQMRIDRTKLERWPELLILYRPYLGAEVVFVVLTLEPEVGRWVRDEVVPLLGEERVVLVCPELIPKFDPVDPRESPHRALLDAMVHARDSEDHGLAGRAILALRELDVEEATLYEEMLLSHLGEELIMRAIRELRTNGHLPEHDDDDDEPLTASELQSFRYVRGHRAGLEQGREQGREEGREEGELRGRANALLDILRLRGLEVDPQVAEQVLACRDAPRLQRWLTRALIVDQARALLDESVESSISPS